MQLLAPDGTELQGEYHDPGAPGPGALLLHMCSPEGNQQGWAPLARELGEAGFHVMTFDYRGFGLTQGEMPSLASMEEAMSHWRNVWMGDVEAALGWLREQDGVDESRLVFGGASCGVFLALELSGRHPDVVALVLLAGPNDSEQESYVRRTPGYSVFGVTGDDPPAPEWMARLFSWTDHPQSRLVFYRDKGHGTELFSADPELAFTIRRWLTAQLSQ